ncbi:hypothetical protein BDN72DRAFT_775753 [Pluteus cervinus]|uniref:Uncharacterized protein n=1 Tax=Pluteus cervinus TaxID=181527 RepID=A0ACD3ADT9_9AGAR|nr:hypothetical protein BDN72DRAFT_775753 [Pluteus cervinus]
MIPLIPTLALAFLSFIASAFVILRIIIPILPPHPLSKRVSPSEFGLPNFRSLTAADKTHVWLAVLDLLTLVLFVWEVVNQSMGGPTGPGSASDPASAIRMWLVFNLRQTCLLVIGGIILLHVRMGRPISFGAKHWMIWSPTLLLVLVSTTFAGVISGAGLNTLFIGITAYASSVAVLSSVAFICLVATLVNIKRNLEALNDQHDPWPPAKDGEEEKPRPSFATEEVDAIRDGASWITSNHSASSSRRNSASAWSFSTHHTSHHGQGRPQGNHHGSVPAKSPHWFNPSSTTVGDVPPVPPLPVPYGPPSPMSLTAVSPMSFNDPDPFRRGEPLPSLPRGRLDSQTSWLTSANGSQTTLSAWSFPPTHHEGSVHNLSTADLHTPLTATTSRPTTPGLAKAQVLGGYGYAPQECDQEKGLASLAAPGTTINISIFSTFGWLLFIWVPLGLALPYLVSILQNGSTPYASTIPLILSITLSAPMLAINVFVCPMPIPSGLFDVRGPLPADPQRPSVGGSSATYKFSHEYKRSTSCSVTVVEGRRSGDVWLSKGDAIDGKSKVGRALTLLNPTPKLSVMPPEEEMILTPPLPMQDGDSSLAFTVHNTPQSETSAQFGRIRPDSKASSHYSTPGDESLAFASHIMIAQRHYSTLAQTMIVSPDKRESQAASILVSGVATNKQTTSHLRTRSNASVSGPQTPSGSSFDITPPPSFPLPPTPPNVRAARLAKLAHKKSFSSGFTFGPVDDMNEIDALTAGVLPLLVPGLTVGTDMKIIETPALGSWSKSKGKKALKQTQMKEFGEDFSSPQIHSTPLAARAREPRARKISHKKNHYSLPSLGLGKDGAHSLATWSADIKGALENQVDRHIALPSNADIGKRNTVFGADTTPNTLPYLHAVREEETQPVGLGRAMSTRTLGLRPEVPHNVNTARSSIVSNIPPSAASTVTLFEEFEAGMESGPQAESTPHNSVVQKPPRQKAPPMPIRIVNEPPQNRRSSIVYIKSDDHVTQPEEPITTTTTTTTGNAFTQWSARAVRPLMPKNKLQRKISNAFSSSNDSKSSSPGGGLRPLSLLQDRDPNTVSSSPSSIGSSGTRPLTLGKKQKKSPVSTESSLSVDENAHPVSPAKQRKLKPLKLVRSETTKMRAILRRDEVVPEVVIRPPSDVFNFNNYRG